MAVLVTFVVPGMDEAVYEQVSATIKQNRPAGLIFHCASVAEGGMGIHDIWESAEAFETFARTQLGPAMASTPAGQPRNMTVTPLQGWWNPAD